MADTDTPAPADPFEPFREWLAFIEVRWEGLPSLTGDTQELIEVATLPAGMTLGDLRRLAAAGEAYAALRVACKAACEAALAFFALSPEDRDHDCEEAIDLYDHAVAACRAALARTEAP